MKILILKANEEIVSQIASEAKVSVQITYATKNTSEFYVAPKKFLILRDKAKEKGYNPFALFGQV